MTAVQLRQSRPSPQISWEILPADYILPDDPVDNTLQPLLAAALRESLELAGLILEANLIATNFGLCSQVDDKIVVKAPDWVYIPSVQPVPTGEIRRSYTPHVEGDVPAIVMEFISETEGSEYSINPHYPYGKWYFYEKILQVPVYAIFHPKAGKLDVYRLTEGKYQQQPADEESHYWIEELNLFLGVWQGKKAEQTAFWLRWWDQSKGLLLWGSEQVEQERQRAEQERQRAEQERQRAEQAGVELEQERSSSQRLAQKLRELGG
ncbi:MAG: Uma2 family endonuclease [Thermosynechococcaceae cyanobacterium]